MICLCSGTPSVTRAKTIVVSGSINLLEEGSSTYHDLDISRKEGWVQWPLNRRWCSKASEKRSLNAKSTSLFPVIALLFSKPISHHHIRYRKNGDTEAV